ncbi:MAG TPA: hypothetical protein ENJ94_09490 [Gammaproteobacteria bacterium]|nr:hypothetical protein [Gammaproteobacteria bacterium]
MARAARPFLLLWLALAALSAWADPTAELDAAVEALQAGRHADALARLRPLAEAGNPRAAFYLSLVYQKGLGVPADPAQALQWLRRAAEAGDAFAQYNLGNHYLNAEPGDAGARKAARWWRKAAEQGLPLAQHNLASLYALDRGVPRDLAKARYWYRKAAEQGLARSAEALKELDRMEGAAALVLVDPQWLAAQPPGSLTLQLLAAGKRDDLEALVPQLGGDLKRPVLLYRVRSGQGRVMWALGYGLFPDAASARAALAELPESMRRHEPWPRSLASIRKALAHP